MTPTEAVILENQKVMMRALRALLAHSPTITHRESEVIRTIMFEVNERINLTDILLNETVYGNQVETEVVPLADPMNGL